MTKEEIGRIIRESRNAAGLTQLQVANALNRPQNTISAWEMGRAQPDANTLFELFQVLGRSVDEAFGFAKDTPPLSADALQMARDFEELENWQKDIIRYSTLRFLLQNQPFYLSLQAIRELNNLSQQELSEKSGIPIERIKILESKDPPTLAERLIKRQELVSLSNVFDVEPSVLQGNLPTYEQAKHLLERLSTTEKPKKQAEIKNE